LHCFFFIFSTISIRPPEADGVSRTGKRKKTKKENRGKKKGRRYYRFDWFEEDGREENNIFIPPVLIQFQITGGTARGGSMFDGEQQVRAASAQVEI
jgi:hypothetical protein